MNYPTDSGIKSTAELRHDIGSDLTVINMGLEALKGVRYDDEQFTDVISMMRANIDSLKEKVKLLSELAADR